MSYKSIKTEEKKMQTVTMMMLVLTILSVIWSSKITTNIIKKSTGYGSGYKKSKKDTYSLLLQIASVIFALLAGYFLSK